jgi:hypothetical protein
LNRTEFFDQPLAELAMPKTPVSPRTARSVQLETSLTAPFEVAGFNPVFNDDVTKFTVDLPTPECHLRFDQIVANLRNSGQAVDLKYDLKDEDVGMVATITCPEFPETGPTDQNSAKEFTKFTEAKVEPLGWEKALRLAGGKNEGLAYVLYNTVRNKLAGKTSNAAFKSACENENFDGGDPRSIALRQQAARILRTLGMSVTNWQDLKESAAEPPLMHLAKAGKTVPKLLKGTWTITPKEEPILMCWAGGHMVKSKAAKTAGKVIGAASEEGYLLVHTDEGVISLWAHDLVPADGWNWPAHDTHVQTAKVTTEATDEAARLQGEIADIQAQLKVAKLPSEKADLKQILVKLQDELKKYTPAEGARSKEDDTMRVAINDNHLDGVELDPVETAAHFGAETAFHLASVSPAMARRRALSGETYDLIKQPNGNYLIKSVSADSAKPQTEDGEQVKDYEDWRKAVKAAYPEVADKLKFKGRVEDGANTISAEVSGEDRSYGVYYPEDEYGVVFGTNEATGPVTAEAVELTAYTGRTLPSGAPAMQGVAPGGWTIWVTPHLGKTVIAHASRFVDGKEQSKTLYKGEDEQKAIEAARNAEVVLTKLAAPKPKAAATGEFGDESDEANYGNVVTKVLAAVRAGSKVKNAEGDTLWAVGGQIKFKVTGEPAEDVSEEEANDIVYNTTGWRTVSAQATKEAANRATTVGVLLHRVRNSRTMPQRDSQEVVAALTSFGDDNTQIDRAALDQIVALSGVDELYDLTIDLFESVNAFTGARAYTNRKGLTESFQINQDTRAPVYRKHLRTGNTSQLIGDSETSEKLEAGVYHVFKDFNGNTFFERKAIRSDELLRFEDGRREHVLDEIRQFWSLRENFAALGLGHKRGVLMFGPPGGGKSCIIKQVVEDAVNSDNVVIYPKSLDGLASIIREFRDVEPDRHILCVLEDVDGLIQYSEHAMLELFDGDDQVNHVLFLATTNYPDRLPPRVMRSGRFDTKIEIKQIPREGRIAYLQSKVGTRCKPEDIENYADLTEDFSFAQMREFVAATFALNQEPKAAVTRIRRNFTE